MPVGLRRREREAKLGLDRFPREAAGTQQHRRVAEAGDDRGLEPDRSRRRRRA